ncbi:hypothetical protein U1Q18_046056 [Sarracenia purpurea var. burkii]
MATSTSTGREGQIVVNGVHTKIWEKSSKKPVRMVVRKQLRCYRTSLLNIWQWSASRARARDRSSRNRVEWRGMVWNFCLLQGTRGRGSPIESRGGDKVAAYKKTWFVRLAIYLSFG